MSQSLPLHLKIREMIARELAAGHRQVGDRLPPESDLALQFGCAVGTLRKAFALLQVDGLIERKHGSGTYVKQAPAQSSVYEFFKLELLKGGGLPTAQILSFDQIKHPNDVPRFGDSDSGGDVPASSYRLRRLRSLDNSPIALEEIYFDERHNTNLTRADLNEALYQFYQKRLNLWIASVQDRVGVGTVPAWTNPLFTPSAGKVCGFIERAAWSAKSQLEEYSRTWFDHELVRYVSRT